MFIQNHLFFREHEKNIVYQSEQYFSLEHYTLKSYIFQISHGSQGLKRCGINNYIIEEKMFQILHFDLYFQLKYFHPDLDVSNCETFLTKNHNIGFQDCRIHNPSQKIFSVLKFLNFFLNLAMHITCSAFLILFFTYVLCFLIVLFQTGI